MTNHPAWKTGPENVRLRLMAASSADKYRQTSYVILDVLQRYAPEVQLDALFVLSTAMAESVGLDPHEMVTRARRILPEAEGPFTEQLQAARDYARGELKK